jgi:hypothetical protein
MHWLILDLRPLDPECARQGYHPLFVFVADLNDDDLVRGIQRHLSDFASQVHG